MKSTIPHIKGAKRIAAEDVDASRRVEVWQGDKGYYIYYYDTLDEESPRVLSKGPLKKQDYAIQFAKDLRDTLRRCIEASIREELNKRTTS